MNESLPKVNHNSIETLIGSNYKKWKEDLEIALGLLDYEMALEEDAPVVPAANASAEVKTKTHILNMLEIGHKLKALSVSVDETMMVHFAINSLPNVFRHLKSSYVTQKEIWTITDLISICVQEEQNIRKEKAEEHVNFVREAKPKAKEIVKNKTTGKKNKKEEDSKGLNPVGLKCFLCRRFGHMKRDCIRYKRWLEKQKGKGKKNFVSVVYESNIVEVLSDSWWLDSGATVHVANSLQGFKSKRVPSRDDLKVFVGNGERVKVEFIGLASLVLDYGFVLDLVDVVYVPTMTRNLLSVNDFSRYGYVFLITEKSKALDMFKVYKAEVEKQLDSKIKVVRSDRGGEFYGKFTEKGRSYRFYCPNHNTRFVETQRAIFIEEENAENGSDEFEFDEIIEQQELAVKERQGKETTIIPFVNTAVTPIHEDNHHDQEINAEVEIQVAQPHNQELRRSQRPRRPALSNDYHVYLQEAEQDINNLEDPATFKQAIESDRCEFWMAAMESELDSMSKNGVWKTCQIATEL
ncbi:unnamed protein product [Prunus brigantina]